MANGIVQHQYENFSIPQKALSANTGIPVLDLICSDVGGNHSGTWAHPEVAALL